MLEPVSQHFLRCPLRPVDVIPRRAEIPLRKFRNMWHVSEDVAVPYQGDNLGKKSLHWPFRVLEPLSRKNLVPLVMESLYAFVQSSWE